MEKLILSVQSHVAYGYVGNRAATFPLQVMGHEVVTVNTVQFSNHTGYGKWTGDVFTPEHIRDILRGLKERGITNNIGAILSGYLGAGALGETIIDTLHEIRTVNPDVIYCCDPVMGDIGRGFFVADDIPPFFKEKALKNADIITPNLFELSALSGYQMKTRGDVIKACLDLHESGPRTILVTSAVTEETKDGSIDMILSRAGNDSFLISTPVFDFDIAPNGSGDMTAALFLGNILKGETSKSALENTAACVYDVFSMTHKLKRRELALIQSRDAFQTNNHPEFKALEIF